MKNFVAIILSLVLFFSFSMVSAETVSNASDNVISIDLSTATDEELETARQAIVQEQKNRIITKVLLDQNDLSLGKGKTAKLSYSVVDLKEGITASKPTWTSSDANVVTVQNGSVRAVNGGKATVTCAVTLSDGTELSADCRVTVVVTAMSLSITPMNISLGIGSSQTLQPVIKPDNVSSKTLKYSSDDSNVVSVDSNGKITAVHGGKATITISTTDGSNKTAKVVVNVPSISASQTEYTVLSKQGSTFKIKYYGTRSNLSVSASNNAYADVSHSLSGNDLSITVKPKVAGTISVTVSDKSDVKSKVVLKVTIDHSAVYDRTSYPQINYTDAYRYPSNYRGEKVSFSGRVAQVMEGWGETTLRISSKGRYDNIVYVTIDNDDITTPIIEGDNVTVYGKYDGNYTYETILHASVTIPKVEAERINVK